GAAEEPLDQVAVGAHAVVIDDMLRDPARCLFRYEGPGDNFIARVQLGDIGVRVGPFLVPGAVDENRDPLHSILPASVESSGSREEYGYTTIGYKPPLRF